MNKNDLFKLQSEKGTELVRIIETKQDKLYVIDCIKRTMPKWIKKEDLSGYVESTEEELYLLTNRKLPELESLDMEKTKKMYQRYTLIAGLLPFVTKESYRNTLIVELSKQNNITKQTIRNYLCLYLVYMDITALAPKEITEKELTIDEKNMRWGLNKFYYTRHKNSLQTAYTMMLQAKYCDGNGKLLPEYPTFNQFRYYFRKNKNMRTYYISRDGVKSYERNNRPLLGDGVQEYASHVGVGMFDATICDIYLVDDRGNLVGRPTLTACVDAYSSLCMGYSLGWEGGVYSLRGLLVNMIADKKKHCEKLGIIIDDSEWDCCKLPAEMITDMGAEYKSENFEQIAELGITITNLPPYRPELKGSIEKFFDCIQGYFKPYLKGKGIIEPDYMERGARDYRKDACLTMEDFEKVLVRCIIYYNTKRIIENYPYSEAMLQSEIQPFSCAIWEWGKLQEGTNLISVDKNTLIYTLLPRTEGRFTRFGLRVNRMRYHCDGYIEQYLDGGEVTVAYNPDDVSAVWLVDKGGYIRFDLIESRYNGKALADVQIMQGNQKELIKGVSEDNLQAKIDLAEHIKAISQSKYSDGCVNIKGIRKTKNREKAKQHIDYVKEGGLNGTLN